jgi:hypothetical protein
MITITLWPPGGGGVLLLEGGVVDVAVGVGLQVWCPRPHGLGFGLPAEFAGVPALLARP